MAERTALEQYLLEALRGYAEGLTLIRNERLGDLGQHMLDTAENADRYAAAWHAERSAPRG